MIMIEYKAGDTIKQKAKLWENKAANIPLNIPTDGSVTIQAFVTEPKRRKVIIPAVDVSHTDVNNDWPNGDIYFEFPNTATGVLGDYDQDEIWVGVRLTKDSKPKTIADTVKAVKMPLNIV